MLELAGSDRRLGAGIVIASPVAWAMMGKGVVRRERGRFDEAEELFNAGLRIATEDGDPETASWTRGNLALVLMMRGEEDAAVALARRNCELTERLGDVFSRSAGLANLATTLLGAAENEAALEAIEEAERVYREAMHSGGELEAWRASVRAEALTGVGRAAEAAELGRWASEVARERGILWSLPLTLLATARAHLAGGRRRAPTSCSTRPRRPPSAPAPSPTSRRSKKSATPSPPPAEGRAQG